MPQLSELADILVKCRVVSRSQWKEAAHTGDDLAQILAHLAETAPVWWEGPAPAPPGLTEYQQTMIRTRFADDELDLLRRDLTLNQFLLLDKLGHGGQGEVYYSRQLNPPRFVAVKILSRDTENSRKRFEQEARAMIKIQHPAVARFHLYERIRDVDGSLKDEYLIAMEFVNGTDLHRLVRRIGPIPWPFAVRWVIDLLGGLMVIHQNGFIHRDVKPENVMIVGPAPGPGVSPAATAAKLLDLGAVKVMDDGVEGAGSAPKVFVGTMEYASPEQWHGEIVVASDLYALGGTLFYAITGRHPYVKERREPVAYRNAHLHERVPDLQTHDGRIPDELNRLLQQMMAKDPEERGTAADLREEFRRFLAQEAATPSPTVAPQPGSTRTRSLAPGGDSGSSQPAATTPGSEGGQSRSGPIDSILTFLEGIFIPEHLKTPRKREVGFPERVLTLLRRPPVLLILTIVVFLLILWAW